MVTHNRALRQDVRELGELLGSVIEAQTSRSTFETVESLRQESIAYRRGDADTRDAFEDRIYTLSPDREFSVVRAFTTYFELINLAEERERIRTNRLKAEEGTIEDTIAEAIDEITSDPELAEQILSDVLIEPTFTAHPTEARRKTVKAKLRSIAGHLEELDQRNLTTAESGQEWRDIESEIVGLWQTSQLRNRRPEPEDEAQNVQWYLSNTLFEIIGHVYNEIERSIAETDADIAVPQLISFRSWAGSDRDGNPFVTPAVTDTTLDNLRTAAISLYDAQLESLETRLSQHRRHVPKRDRLERSIQTDASQLPQKTTGVAEDLDEPYRVKLAYMRERLARVDDLRPGGYSDSTELIDDLELLASTLRANNAALLAETVVDPVIRQVETFGFTLASLDLRDHREVHTAAVAELFSREDIAYRSLDEAERQSVLTEAITADTPIIDLSDTDGISSDTAQIMERFTSLARWHETYGPDAIDTYCISMTEHPSHVLEVVFLASQAGVIDHPDYAGLDIVPLLETESALSRSREIMGTLFDNPAYAQLIENRDRIQEVMIGYSDSNKENGFLAANWSLYSNQRELATITDEYDLTLRLFHGRGGSISRGGGPMNRALLALPTETIDGPVKFTVQGEAIAENYGNPDIATREVEQMVNAQLRTRKRALEHTTDDFPASWERALDEMATTARTTYQELLASDGFVSYFETVTPISVIDDLNLGSRPTSRTGERRPEDLRAIPWVFSWTQTRCIIPGWYGFGTAIETYLEAGGTIEELRGMYANWPFFATIVDNAAMAAAKSDMEIAAVYANLADPDLRSRFFPTIEAEYERTVESIRRITERETLVDRSWLADSLALRNPYVDPLNYLQASLLGRSHRSDREERTLRLTVKGIAAGMKNTG